MDTGSDEAVLSFGQLPAMHYATLFRARFAALAFALVVVRVGAQTYTTEEEGTFSIIGRDPATGELGIAVQSHTIAVGARVRGGKGGLAVFAHQAGSDPMYSDIGIKLLEQGMTPQQALDYMLKADDGGKQRQVAILDIQGRVAAWTSPSISEWKGHKTGVNYSAQGNTLTGPDVVNNMAASFEASVGKEPLAERLLHALEAGQKAGGDKRGMESCGLMILKPLSVQGYGDRVIDLRVDESANPYKEMDRLLAAVRAGELRTQVAALLKANDLKGAMEKAITARDMSPEIDAGYITLAEVYLRTDHKAEALAAVAKSIEINPANKRQLPLNKTFEPLLAEPEFKKIIAQ